MSLDASYVFWGGAFTTILALSALLLVIFVVRGVNHLKKTFYIHPENASGAARPANITKDNEHRALMFLMNQKTDSMLAALAHTIEQERQKLGIVVRNPSMTGEIDTHHAPTPEPSDRRQTAYEQVLPLAQNGAPVETIARQLDLSEAEVSLVMRLGAT